LEEVTGLGQGFQHSDFPTSHWYPGKAFCFDNYLSVLTLHIPLCLQYNFLMTEGICYAFQVSVRKKDTILSLMILYLRLHY